MLAGEAQGETVEQQIGGARRDQAAAGRRAAAGPLRYAAAEPAGDGRRVESFQVCVSRELALERVEPPGRIQQQRARPRRCG